MAYLNLKRIPMGRVRDKVAHDKTWAVMSGHYDYSTDTLNYVIMTAADKSEQKQVTKKEICEMFGWKDYSLAMNGELVLPEMMAYEDWLPKNPKRCKYKADGTCEWV